MTINGEIYCQRWVTIRKGRKIDMSVKRMIATERERKGEKKEKKERGTMFTTKSCPMTHDSRERVSGGKERD